MRARLAGLVLLALAGIGAAPTLPAPAPKARLTVSKDTTYFIGPLKPDGTVDYAAAWSDAGADRDPSPLSPA